MLFHLNLLNFELCQKTFELGVGSVKSRRTVLRSLAAVYAGVFAAMLLLANTAVGRVVIDEWHRTGMWAWA